MRRREILKLTKKKYACIRCGTVKPQKIIKEYNCGYGQLYSITKCAKCGYVWFCAKETQRGRR